MTAEENIAILMADLTGYTALTETHGASSAADLIDKYLEIVATCLVGDSSLKERTGDEIMIVSSSADSLLATAMLILNKTAKEENFLQVHCGLHYGRVLHRNNSYFGSAINLTARITAKANPGTLWCSEDFFRAITNTAVLNFQSKGKHSFKNINDEVEIVELAHMRQETFYIDPVCRMLILNKEMAVRYPGPDPVYFCSDGCRHIYHSNNPGSDIILTSKQKSYLNAHRYTIS
ncbi:adenylate/guanylate cyclase domain-containing protein [Flavitalea antarctica]